MSKKSWILGSVLVALLIGAAIFLYYYYQSRAHRNVLFLYGNVDVRQVDIGFRVAGQVEKLYFEEGDFVRAGTHLATLDKTPYNSQIEQTKANVEAIKVNLQNEEKLLQRRKELISLGGVSEEDLENTQSSRDAFIANLQAAEAAHTIALDNLSYTEVFAPTDGIILTRIREPGTVVNPADPVYTISITSPVWIRAFVNEPQLGQIFYGMTATVLTDTEGGPTYTGKIGFISPIAEFTPKTVETTQLRTDLVYRLRIYVDNPDCNLKQGMPVTVKLDLKEPCERSSN